MPSSSNLPINLVASWENVTTRPGTRISVDMPSDYVELVEHHYKQALNRQKGVDVTKKFPAYPKKREDIKSWAEKFGMDESQIFRLRRLEVALKKMQDYTFDSVRTIEKHISVLFGVEIWDIARPELGWVFTSITILAMKKRTKELIQIKSMVIRDLVEMIRREYRETGSNDRGTIRNAAREASDCRKPMAALIETITDILNILDIEEGSLYDCIKDKNLR